MGKYAARDGEEGAGDQERRVKRAAMRVNTFVQEG
jgi:hypothetical protein